jgi:D-amino-acid dehydrogenase
VTQNDGKSKGSVPPIVVVGAGVVGVMTARALARRGQQVKLIDGLPGPAELCSRANAGILAVGHATAWAGPGALPTMVRAALGREPSIRITRIVDPALWRWGLDFLGQCSAEAHRVNSEKLRRLSRFSRDLLAPAEAEMGLPKETRHSGALYLFQDKSAFETHVASLGDHNETEMESLDRAGVLALEPGLAGMDRLAGGILCHADSVGDCRLFTTRTCTYLADRNSAELLFGRRVTGFRREGRRIAAVETDAGAVECDAVVLATGVETPDLCRPLGFAPQIYPVKGYSGTWTVTDTQGIPIRPFVDETELLAVASYGGKLRVTAIAEFAGHDRSLRADRTALLDAYVRRNFGRMVDLETPEYWAGLRPSTPAGPPYLGRVRHYENFWMNAGHGQLGWTMSLGCGEILSALITGEAPPISAVSARARWLDAA